MNGKLHHYTADTTDRTRVHIYLFGLSVLASWGLHKVLIALGIEPLWWIEPPSIFGFYAIFFKLFDYYLWRNRFFRFVFDIKTPDLNGAYTGHISSSYDKFASKKTVKYEILQRWNKILVFSETETSTSKSLTAAFSLVDVNASSLIFNYQNTPKAGAVQTMNIHYGFTELFFKNSEYITGDFFTGRGRETYGRIELKRM